MYHRISHEEHEDVDDFWRSPVFKSCRNCIEKHIRNIEDVRKRRILIIQEIAIAVKTLHEQSIYISSCYWDFEAIMKDFWINNPREVWNMIPGAWKYVAPNTNLSMEIIAFIDSVSGRAASIIAK